MSEKDPTHDLFDRLRAAADAVPPSTLDLPVVLIGSRRKARARRAATGVTAVAAVALLGVGVASGVPSQVVRDLAPAAAYETVSSEIVHEEVAPGITAVTQAATYELPGQTRVTDTGLETGAHGDRFLIVSSYQLVAGAGEDDAEPVSVDPGTGEPVTPPNPRDPEYIERMAELGYPPSEMLQVQVVVGDEAELARIREGGEPTTVVVEDLSSIVTVDAGTRRFVFGTVPGKGVYGESDSYVSSWDPFDAADGTMDWTLPVPTLATPAWSSGAFVLDVTDAPTFAPQMTLTFSDGSRGARGCAREGDGCTVSLDPQARAVSPGGPVDPRWVAPVDPVQLELNAMRQSNDERDILFRCLELRGAANGLTATDLNDERQDLLIDDRDTMVRCVVNENLALFSAL